MSVRDPNIDYDGPVLWPFFRDATFRVEILKRIGYAFDHPADFAECREKRLHVWERMPVDHPVHAFDLARIRKLHEQYLSGHFTPVNTWGINPDDYNH